MTPPENQPDPDLNSPPVVLPQASGIIAPIDHTTEGLRIWVLETCRYLQITPSELAKGAGLAASTLNRFLRVQDEASLSAKTIAALLAAAQEMEAKPEFRERPATDGSLEHPYLVDVQVMGRVGAGVFATFRAFAQKFYTLRVPIKPPFHRLGIGAYEVADNHAFPEFPQGSLVIVTPLGKTPLVEPKNGDFVVIFQVGPGNTLELTIRKFVVSPSGEVWLVVSNPPTPRPEVNTLRDIFLGSSGTYHFSNLKTIKRPFALVLSSIRYSPFA